MPALNNIYSSSEEPRKRAPPYSSSQSAWSLSCYWLAGPGPWPCGSQCSSSEVPFSHLTCLTPRSTFITRNGSHANSFSGPLRSHCKLLLLSASHHVLSFSSKQSQLLAKHQSLQFPHVLTHISFKIHVDEPFNTIAVQFCELLSANDLVIYSFSAAQSRLIILHLSLSSNSKYPFSSSLLGNEHGSHF